MTAGYRCRQWVQQDVRQSAEENYSPLSLFLLFFIFSFFGWCWEVSYHLVIDHRFINRGILFGPWLPIYGAGGVMILLILRHFFERPGELFLMIMLVCGIMEYLTGWALETIWHTRWWDYREYRFQIQGRVSLIGLLIFGTGGLAIVYWIAPKCNQWFEKKEGNTEKIVAGILFVLFLADIIYSMRHPNQGAGITVPVNLGLRRV